ncbi:hypothetical protein CNEONATNEC26_01623 [Clostridium neonatale]|nr:hypothetical protein CNEONATNEC26_01623 [Clostridium neonatale]
MNNFFSGSLSHLLLKLSVKFINFFVKVASSAFHKELIYSYEFTIKLAEFISIFFSCLRTSSMTVSKVAIGIQNSFENESNNVKKQVDKNIF